MHQLCFLYMLNYLVMYSLSEREREGERESGSKHARTCVYLSRIETSFYHQELVPHPMTEHVDELSN